MLTRRDAIVVVAATLGHLKGKREQTAGGPLGITLVLDSAPGITVYYKGEKQFISSEEIMAALRARGKSPTDVSIG